jgi:hypothetical protein
MSQTGARLLPGALALAMVTMGCPTTGTGGSGDGGNPSLDTACQSMTAAKQNPNCQFSAGSQPVELCNPNDKSAPQCAADQVVPAGQACGYLMQQLESNWWQINIANLPPRPILTVVAEYCAPSTQVNLNINVLGPDGITGLPGGNATAAAGNPTPPPVTVVTRLTGSGPYFVQVQADTSESDPGTSPVETYYPYKIYAFVVSDPNLNWPDNDPSLATPLCQGACQSGTCCTPDPNNGSWSQGTGAISVTGDVNWFTFDVPPFNAPPRDIVFLHVHADALPSSTSNQLQLQYTLYPCPNPPSGSPNACGTPGTPISTDYARDPLVAQDLVTARIVQPGRYAIEVQGYEEVCGIAPPGNPLLTYTVDASLYQDIDVNEGTTGNDVAAMGTPINFNGTSATVSGRVSYVPDQDWYALTVPAAYTRLHYKLTFVAGATPPRFSIPSADPHELRVLDGQLNLLSIRDEDGAVEKAQGSQAGSPSLANFEGIVALSGTSQSTQQILVDFGIRDSTGVDDRQYQIQFDLLPPTPDEGASVNGAIPLNLGCSGSTCSGTATSYIGYGVGYSPRCYQDRINDPNNGRNALQSCDNLPNSAPDHPGSMVPVGANDCDNPDGSGNCGSDVDVIGVTYPSSIATGADVSLGISWTIHPVDGSEFPWAPAQGAGDRAYDVVFELPSGLCSSCGDRDLGYSSQQATPWYDLSGTTPVYMNLSTFDTNGGNDNFGFASAACMCIPGSAMAQNPSGFQISVAGVNRVAWADSAADITITLGPYPPQGSSCPSPCKF